tara:strand:- start:305 stop:1087 length:783 start_codon:yes stop_codon:yes gene_type:complete
MDSKLDITVLLPTFNSEKTVKKTLDSISWAKEIIIIDSFSNDLTLDIAKKYKNINIIQHEYINSAKQKNWSLDYCNYDWILQIDSDEILDDNSDKIIRDAIQNANQKIKCFRFKRKNFVLGKWVKYGGFYPDWQYRLFRKDYAKWNDREVHANLLVEGDIKTIELKIIHNGMPNISKQLGNLNRYSRYEADEMLKKGEKFMFSKWIVGSIAIFFKKYFFQFGFLDGWRGFLLAIYTAFYFFISYAKFLELKVLRLEKSPR